MNVYLEAAALVRGSYRLNKGSMEWLSHEGGLCYCAMGAILKVDGKLAKYDGLDDPTDEPWFTELMEPVARYINAGWYDDWTNCEGAGPTAYRIIYTWNDAEERTKSDVVEMLEAVGNLQERLIAGIKQAENGETKSLPEFE